MYQQHMFDTEIMETYFEIYIYQESYPLAVPLKNISICKSVLKYLSLCLYLHDSYIPKFYLINYAFAKLIHAWL